MEILAEEQAVVGWWGEIRTTIVPREGNGRGRESSASSMIDGD